LQTFVEFESVTENFRDLEVIVIDPKRNASATTRIRRVYGVKFEPVDIEVWVRCFSVAKVELVDLAGSIMAGGFVPSDPRENQLQSRFIVSWDDIILHEDVAADVDTS
jgi:hypothetical protein